MDSAKSYYDQLDLETEKQPAFKFFGIKSAEAPKVPRGSGVIDIARVRNHGTCDGKCTGMYKPSQPGVVRLRWFNEASVVRTKTIEYKVQPLPCGPTKLRELFAAHCVASFTGPTDSLGS
jgi:hypothetical protein